MKKETKLSDLALKGAILYLALHAFDSLIRTAFGGFLILSIIATAGISLIVACVFYFLFGCDYSLGAVLIISAILGSVTALNTCSEIYGKRARRRRRRNL